MRTVAFADEHVVDLINERYIPVWNNHNPQRLISGVQPQYDEAVLASFPEGGGVGKLRTYMVTADGRILSEIQGYWLPERFREELAFALELTPENAAAKHAERSRSLRDEAARLAADPPEEKSNVAGLPPVRNRIAALTALADWHERSRAKPLEPVAQALERARAEAVNVRILCP